MTHLLLHKVCAHHNDSYTGRTTPCVYRDPDVQKDTRYAYRNTEIQRDSAHGATDVQKDTLVGDLSHRPQGLITVDGVYYHKGATYINPLCKTYTSNVVHHRVQKLGEVTLTLPFLQLRSLQETELFAAENAAQWRYKTTPSDPHSGVSMTRHERRQKEGLTSILHSCLRRCGDNLFALPRFGIGYYNSSTIRVEGELEFALTKELTQIICGAIPPPYGIKLMSQSCFNASRRKEHILARLEDDTLSADVCALAIGGTTQRITLQYPGGSKESKSETERLVTSALTPNQSVTTPTGAISLMTKVGFHHALLGPASIPTFSQGVACLQCDQFVPSADKKGLCVPCQSQLKCTWCETPTRVPDEKGLCEACRMENEPLPQPSTFSKSLPLQP